VQSLLVGYARDKQNREGHIATTISTLIMQMFMAASDLQRFQSKVMEVLTDSHHGKISPLLLTPQQLSDEIVKIKSHLPPHTHIPIEGSALTQIYKLLTVSGTIADNHVLFNVQLPLANNKGFQLFNVAPIIAIRNKRLLAIKTRISLMAISLHRDEFFAVTEDTLDRCLQLSSESYLCHVQSTYHESSTNRGCEMALFNKDPVAKCEIQELKDSMIWHQLKHLNRWVFATNHSTILNTVCGTNTSQLTINGSGIIQLEPGCVMKTETITIQGHRDIMSNIKTAYHSTGVTMITAYPVLENKTKVADDAVSTTQEFDVIQQQLKIIKESSFPEQSITYHHHGTIIGYILAVLVMYLTVRTLRSKCHPTPSNQLSSKCNPAQATPQPQRFVVNID